MKVKQPVSRPPGRRPRRGLFLTVALALFVVLGVARMGTAAQGDSGPVSPESEAATPSPYSQMVPTDEQLTAMPAGIERYLSAHTLPSSAFQPANLVDSTKTASKSSVRPSEAFDYTIVIRNTGQFDIPVEMTDSLPAQVSHIDTDCVAFITDLCAFNSGTVTWRGTVREGGQTTVTISVQLKANANDGMEVINTARIASADQTFNRSATITVDVPQSSPVALLPIALYGRLPAPSPVTLHVGEPNGLNAWLLSWTASAGAHGYDIQEAHNPDFSDATTSSVGQINSQTVTKSPTPFNVYYYRVRSRVGNQTSEWSNVGRVVGGYRDDFDNSNTGWAMRRSTYREDVKGFYEDGKYVMQIFDRWDWGIVSPLQPAPRVPYVIDFEMRTVSQIYAHSAGLVFGGDWNGETCPPGTSFDEWYKHDNCFNHFYNTNTIYNDTNPNAAELQLLFERIDRLQWCPNCGGSPMKRIGDVSNLKRLRNVNAKEWNHFRIEVQADNIRFYAAPSGQELKLEYEYDHTRWISSPYFGFFASTDVIDSLTWRFDYVQIMPID